MKKKFFSLFLCLVFILAAVPVSQAKESQLSVKEKLIEMGVDEKKVDVLESKIYNGEKLDSMKEEFDNIEPVEKKWLNNNTYSEKYVYPDGSIKSLSISGGYLTGTIESGSYSSGTYWWAWENAKVVASWGFVTASFRANMSGSVGSGSISKVYDYAITTIGGSFSNQSLRINRSEATKSYPAQATLFFTATSIKDAFKSTFYLRLKVPYAKFAEATLSMS